MPTNDPDQTTLFSTSLEPPETKPQNPYTDPRGRNLGTDSLAETFRHSGWQRRRLLVYESLQRTMQSVGRIMYFACCGSAAFVYKSVSDPVEFRIGGSSCRDRFCIPCAADRSHVLAANVLEALDGKTFRFLTLTLKQNDAPLAVTLDRLYDAFRRLRMSRIWRCSVLGGCAFLEIKLSKSGESWNVHLHCIVHGKYLPQNVLSATWHKITGDSMITDVRWVPDRKKVVGYVTKYVSKPLDNSYVNRPSKLDEMIVATRGRRLCLTFGDWRGIKLTETISDREWESIGSFQDVIRNAWLGEKLYVKALAAIAGERSCQLIDAYASARPPPREEPKGNPQHIMMFPNPFPWQDGNDASLAP